MPFPETARVVYANNPLEEVIAQVRFPPILRIDDPATPPASFQEAIRQSFQVLDESSGLESAFSLPTELAAQVPAEIVQQLSAFRLALPQAARTFTFRSQDGDWAMVLSRDSLSLTSKAYRHW